MPPSGVIQKQTQMTWELHAHCHKSYTADTVVRSDLLIIITYYLTQVAE